MAIYGGVNTTDERICLGPCAWLVIHHHADEYFGIFPECQQHKLHTTLKLGLLQSLQSPNGSGLIIHCISQVLTASMRLQYLRLLEYTQQACPVHAFFGYSSKEGRIIL